MKKSPSPAKTDTKLTVQRDGKGKIFSHVRQKWLVETPEESVRQEFLCVLVNEYGYALDQIAEEEQIIGRGSGKARADHVIWRTADDKKNKKAPLVIVECKSDNITISEEDYSQGENYARITDAPFFLTHNNKETRFWRVRKDRMPGYIEEIEDIPHAEAGDKDIAELLSKLKIFRENEFADVLHKCHNIIRSRDNLDPAAAFDEIAKLLFVKTCIERQLKAKKSRKNRFSVETIEVLEANGIRDPINKLFDDTKDEYKVDRLFGDNEKIGLSHDTVIGIVRELERYNLSETSEDVKGVAFERFLGRTFRGEIGQFFTPRPIVEFIIRMLDPQENDVICDPASGSGGFLIRAFEIIRQRIYASGDREYQAFKAKLDADKKMPESARAEKLLAKFRAIQDDVQRRITKLSNKCIYGTDANDRMARTSKMNMIMHGDGHGGIHHRNGFLNVNGIFEGRFDIIVTNPPFGSTVDATQTVTPLHAEVKDDERKAHIKEYGKPYEDALARLEAAVGKPIMSMFALPYGDKEATGKKLGKIKTEILFIERCLDLLKPGGRLGIVLPEGIFNNPSLEYVRHFTENRAYIRAIVSMPAETFVASGASVKTSLLFLEKFSVAEQKRYDKIWKDIEREIKDAYGYDARVRELEQMLEIARAEGGKKAIRDAERELDAYKTSMEDRVRVEGRPLFKKRFNYPVFLYNAEKVGITSTGDDDENELYPNDRVPKGIVKTALEQYREFLKDPKPFFG